MPPCTCGPLKHTSKAIIDGSPGEIVVQSNARKTTLRNSKFVVFAAFEVGHASFVREALGSMTPNHANLESNHNPRDYGVKRMGADEALNLA